MARRLRGRRRERVRRVDEGSRLARAWANAFPEAYKEDYQPQRGSADLGRIEAIQGEEGIDLALFDQDERGGHYRRGESRLKVFRVGEPLSLSAMLPMLTSMGVEVVDERPYELDRARPALLHLRVRPAPRPDARRPASAPCSPRRCARCGTATTRSTASTSWSSPPG